MQSSQLIFLCSFPLLPFIENSSLFIPTSLFLCVFSLPLLLLSSPLLHLSATVVAFIAAQAWEALWHAMHFRRGMSIQRKLHALRRHITVAPMNATSKSMQGSDQMRLAKLLWSKCLKVMFRPYPLFA